MSGTYVLIVAGLSVEQYDAVRKVSDNLLAPGGKAIIKPAKSGLSDQYAMELIGEATKWAASQDEKTRISILLLVAGPADEQSQSFLKKFFPFALPCRIQPPMLVSKPARRRSQLNSFTDQIVEMSKRLREKARKISHYTSLGGTGPLLLPVRNFRNSALSELLEYLSQKLSGDEDVDQLISAGLDAFDQRCPRVKPEGEEKKRCYSDGELYFHGPGRNRHGFFRNSQAKGHPPHCLLNARSRMGGHYDYVFHFDCAPVDRLKTSYPNCHDEMMAPKQAHVNIAPNDFVI